MIQMIASQVTDTGNPMPHTQPEEVTFPEVANSISARKGIINNVNRHRLYMSPRFFNTKGGKSIQPEKIQLAVTISDHESC